MCRPLMTRTWNVPPTRKRSAASRERPRRLPKTAAFMTPEVSTEKVSSESRTRRARHASSTAGGRKTRPASRCSSERPPLSGAPPAGVRGAGESPDGPTPGVPSLLAREELVGRVDAGVPEALGAREQRRDPHARAAPQFERVVSSRGPRVRDGREELNAARARALDPARTHALGAHVEEQSVGRVLGRALDDALNFGGLARLDHAALVERSKARVGACVSRLK